MQQHGQNSVRAVFYKIKIYAQNWWHDNAVVRSACVLINSKMRDDEDEQHTRAASCKCCGRVVGGDVLWGDDLLIWRMFMYCVGELWEGGVEK